MRITPDHINHLKRHGHVLVPGFLSGSKLKAAQSQFLRYFPTDEELRTFPQRYGSIFEDPEHLQVEFPFASDALNHISTHPDLIDIVEHLLQTRVVLLSQSAIWAKYAGTGDFEQGLHLDYQGNTLVVPRDDGTYRQVNMILYYTDVPMDMGPTYVVSQEKTRTLPLWPTHRTRKSSAALYRHERPVLAQAGDLLIFSMRIWHRASAMVAKSGARFSHHLVWRSACHAFQGYHNYASRGENPNLARYIESTSPRQREAIGFPPPGDSYWNKETLEAVGLRYPKMDLNVYRRS